MAFCKLYISAALLAWGSAGAQSLDELRAQYPGDNAVILDYRSDTRFFMEGGVPKAETRITQKLMILDDKANGQFNKFEVYHGDFTAIDHLEAYTDVPGGKRLKVTEIKTESAEDRDVFYDDVKRSVFDFPNLSKGAIAYVSYTETEKELHLFSPFYFIRYIPVVHESYSVTFPSDMEVLYDVKNDSAGIIHVDKDEKGREHGYTFSADHVRPMTMFEDAPTPAWYEPHAIVRLGSYKADNGARVPFLQNLKDLYAWDYSFIGRMDSLSDGQLRVLADSLTRGLTNPEDKAASIYHWVQHHIRYVAFEDGLEGFIPRPAALVCNRRFGDCKDMASLLTALLRMAGLDAYFTWIGTRDIPYDHTDLPLPLCDNHMISTFKVGDRWIFLDGTDPNCIFGYPSAFIQGKQALVALSPTEYRTLRVPVIRADSSKVTDSTFIAWTGSGLKGSSSVYYHGYYGSDVCDHLLFKDTSDARDYVKYRMGKGSNKFILNDYSIRYLDDERKLVNIRAGFDIPGYGKTVGQELYINLNLEKFFTGATIIDTARRKVPLAREYESVIDQFTVFDIPQGYELSYLPKDFAYSDNNMDFSIEYTQKTGQVICRQTLSGKTLLMSSGDFPRYNGAVKQILNHYKEQLVFVKKNGL
jgi:hypothetical protein